MKWKELGLYLLDRWTDVHNVRTNGEIRVAQLKLRTDCASFSEVRIDVIEDIKEGILLSSKNSHGNGDHVMSAI